MLHHDCLGAVLFKCRWDAVILLPRTTQLTMQWFSLSLGVKTEGFLLFCSRHVFYHLSHTSGPPLCYLYFE
jgi:hypothetical protein